MQNIVSVALDVPLYQLFDYSTSNIQPKIGCRVKVQFGKSTRIGIIMEIKEFTKEEIKYKLKEVIEVIDNNPLLSDEIIKTCKWASKYYHYPLGQVLFSAMTPIHRKNKPVPKKKMKIINKECSSELRLNVEQESISANILRKINNHNVNLIRGVTGSGKTEVYSKLAKNLLEKDAQVLVMVPEINLTPQTILRFDKYLDIEPIEYHSNMTPAQKYRVWKACTEEKKLIVIGTRSSVFLPFNNLKLLIVDEEHDQSYKQTEMLKYNARDIGVLRTRNFKCPVVLGSATPSFETIHNVNIKKYKQHVLTKRYFNSKLPLITIVDTSIDKPDEGISRSLYTRMNEELDRNNRVILFIGRRGFSNSVICTECKSIIKCPKCDVYMTYHKNVEKLICHQCEYNRKLEDVKDCCHKCKLIPLGIGTQRIENKIKELFPHKNVLRVDSDNISSNKDLKEFISSANNDEIDIFIGTQMIVKGHDFNNISLVGIINIDAGLYSTDFRGLERTGQLITQVAGRSGRQETQGNVIIQTNNPEHELLQTILKKGYDYFSKIALKQRQSVNLPPFSHIGTVKISSSNKYKVKSLLLNIKEIKKDRLVFIYGPTPSTISKKNDQYFYQLIIGSKSSRLLSEHITRIKLYLSTVERKYKWSIDIDPIE